MAPRRGGRHDRSVLPTTKVTVEVLILPQELNLAVGRYYEKRAAPAAAGPWLQIEEVPTSEEITRRDMLDERGLPVPTLGRNLPRGAWPDKETYLQTQYEFLREEAVRPLREAVSQVKFTPNATEDSFNGEIRIYEKVRIIGLITSTRGIAIRVTFSTKRAGKQIRWEQANRLLTGTLVALTPSKDMFSEKTVVATVAARPLEGLQQNPPELELFFARPAELELDPAIEWTMVESRNGFFEAERHTLLALQKLIHEPSPLFKHLVNIEEDIDAPAWLKRSQTIDLRAVDERLKNVDTLNAWPEDIASELDASQLDALQRTLTKSLAIVQGPPGTGKTFLSVKALQVMLANRSQKDPPIVVTCQTNHALDQLLRHVADFEPQFARLGGRSKDAKVIKERTMYNLRLAAGKTSLSGCKYAGARKTMQIVEKEIELLLSTMKNDQKPLDHRRLVKLQLLSEAQATSLEDGTNKWFEGNLRSPAEASWHFDMWLDNALIKVAYKPQLENFGFEYEEEEVEFEQLQDIEAENAVKDDEYIDSLTGSLFTLADNYTCFRSTSFTDSDVVKLLRKEQDLWKIDPLLRPSVYHYLQTRMKELLLIELRSKAARYDAAAFQARIGNWEKDELLLREQKVIGLTTTGLSKYRGLIAALGCKIILVEEAAETLEAPVIAACVPTLEHLILVGDHKQLRPHCRIREHEKKPYNFNVSMFERLINNNLGMTTLVKQRRMIPEVRRILRPIYGDIIQDHESVKDPDNRPDVNGMGGINSYFFAHTWPERRDALMSCINEEEASMIVGFVEHLVYNGIQDRDITILTFYNGQRKLISKGLRKSTAVGNGYFKVVTVDSYQGEENKVVILSLVRSNQNNSIGFLAVDNRVCVALSRAQCGFYLFGNAMLLSTNKTWSRVMKIMAGQDTKHAEEIPLLEPQRFHGNLPVHCSKHDTTVNIVDPAEWQGLSGGCKRPCGDVLSCGHTCLLSCHPFSHDLAPCHKPCQRMMACGHKCAVDCSEACVCKTCSQADKRLREVTNTNKNTGLGETSSPAEARQVFAENEAARAVTSNPPSSNGHSRKEELLIDFDEEVMQDATNINESIGLRETVSSAASWPVTADSRAATPSIPPSNGHAETEELLISLDEEVVQEQASDSMVSGMAAVSLLD